MGVKGLFQFLRRFEKDVSIAEYCKGRAVGVDIFWFLHQSKGDFFALQNMLLGIIKNSATVHCVFDGAPPPEKWGELKALAERRAEIHSTIDRIEAFIRFPFTRLNGEARATIREYLAELRREAWTPSPEYINLAKKWLTSKNCHIYQAVGEADNLLVELEQQGIIEAIITNDSDLLVLGGKMILRPKNPLRASLFDRELICVNMGFTAQQWSDFMYLCRYLKCDDVGIAYSFVSVYKDLDLVLQKYYTLYNECLIEEVC